MVPLMAKERYVKTEGRISRVSEGAERYRIAFQSDFVMESVFNGTAVA